MLKILMSLAVVTLLAPQAYAESPWRSTYKVECFQAGQKVFSQSNLQIRRTGPNRSEAQQFYAVATKDALEIVINQIDLACIFVRTSK